MVKLWASLLQNIKYGESLQWFKKGTREINERKIQRQLIWLMMFLSCKMLESEKGLSFIFYTGIS